MDDQTTMGKPGGMRTPQDMAQTLLKSMRPTSARAFADKMAELAQEHVDVAERDNSFWAQVVDSLRELPS